MHANRPFSPHAGHLGILAALLLVQSGFGNGGGYHYGVEFTGAVAPFEPTGVERIQILDEKLEITIGDEEAEVEVRYVMKNTTDKRTTVTFGFPVEARAGDIYDFSWDLEGDEAELKQKKHRLIAQKKKELQEAAARHCADYKFTLDGQLQNHKHLLDPLATGQVDPFPGSEILDGIIGWNVSTIEFAPGQERSLKIGYRAMHDQEGWSTTHGTGYFAAAFRYRLSTGGVWAGPIVKGSVRVKFIGAEAKWAEIKKPDGRFERSGDGDSMIWTWKFENLEPKRSDDIEILAGPAVEFNEVDKRLHAVHQKFEALASSTLKPGKNFTYVADNIVGPRYDRGKLVSGDSAWSEGVPGDGVGESLTLAIDIPLPLHALQIRPGYGKSDELFQANGRPSELLITLNGEHSFVAEFDDLNRLQGVRIPVSYRKPVKSVRLEIKKVYPGSQFADTCISHVRLVAHLAERPATIK